MMPKKKKTQVVRGGLSEATESRCGGGLDLKEWNLVFVFS